MHSRHAGWGLAWRMGEGASSTSITWGPRALRGSVVLNRIDEVKVPEKLMISSEVEIKNRVVPTPANLPAFSENKKKKKTQNTTFDHNKYLSRSLRKY